MVCGVSPQCAHLTLHHAAPAPQQRVEALARRQPEVEAGVWLGVWPHLARHRGPAPPAHVPHHVEALAGEGSALGVEVSTNLREVLQCQKRPLLGPSPF